VVKHSKDVLTEALAVGGTSISDYRRIDDKTGEFQNFLRVYQKCECPLGHPIANVRLGGRSSFYCPVCQK
jgi:formamidopyrimidine-DNA glycosylase